MTKAEVKKKFLDLQERVDGYEKRIKDLEDEVKRLKLKSEPAYPRMSVVREECLI